MAETIHSTRQATGENGLVSSPYILLGGGDEGFDFQIDELQFFLFHRTHPFLRKV